MKSPTAFLPINQADLRSRGWDQCDFIVVSGDAYVDHPSFGSAIVARVLESCGFRVGFLAQPDWKDPAAFAVLGTPRYGFFVGAGNLDSMVNHYTVNRRLRSQDAYSPGGESGHRPDRATIVYTGMLKRVHKGVPVIIGGIEASLRRLAHYDYWQDKLRKSILLDSKADMLIYGMGERAVKEIARRLASGEEVREMRDIAGTVFATSQKPKDGKTLPDFSSLVTDRKRFAKSFFIQHQNTDPFWGSRLVEPYENRFVVQNPPAKPLSTEEMDEVYDLPFTRTYHPVYKSQGGVPGLKEVQFSIVSNRGCFGGCHFCSLAFHQGKIVSVRSHESILREAKGYLTHPEFKGIIHDVGGPTANFRKTACKKQAQHGSCRDRSCLGFQSCKNLEADHSDYVELLRKIKALPGIRKVFIRSGIRYDYLLRDPDPTFLRELCRDHVSGQLKVAPEHAQPEVLKLAGKPSYKLYKAFRQRFLSASEAAGKKQYLIPYLISSLPGSDLKSAIYLAEILKKEGFQPDQVQDFYPTPGTLSTSMYYSGVDPETSKSVYVARGDSEKRMQRALLQFKKRENHEQVRRALIKCKRFDLIGHGKNCLVPPGRQKKLYR